MKYLISTIEYMPCEFISFEKQTEEQYADFLEIMKKRPFLGLGGRMGEEYSSVQLEYGKDWFVEDVKNEKRIEAIELLWKDLPHEEHLETCMVNYYDNSSTDVEDDEDE